MSTRWQTAQLCEPAQGETESGDRVVEREADGERLLVVIDALGHGRKAAEAATVAEKWLLALEWPSAAVTSQGILEELHRQLRGTRGAAAMVCLVRGTRLEGCGVGNVELRSVGTSVPVMLSPGVLGSGSPIRLRPFSAELTAPTSLFLFSDGVSSRAPFTELARLTAAEACGVLARDHRKAHDDGSVLVAKLDRVAHGAGN